MKTIKFYSMKNLMVLAACLLFGLPAMAQQFLMDKPIGAAGLTLFPDLNNEDEYYYLPNKVALGTHADGKPQFSFIKYARSTDAQGGSDQITETGEAGGIIHAVVNMKVPEEQIKEAERGLRRLKSNAKIVGPVVYKSGTIMLVSSFNKEGENVKRVVGLGTAPILEDQKAAISVHLSKKAADILWATFDTPTPDFSISFEMEMEGFLSPKRAKIEANWDRIYKHKAFEAAVAAPILSAEIKTAYDELRDNGAITVTQVGEDAQMDKLIESAYNQIANLMFDKIAGSGVPDVKSLFPGSDKSMLDRASENLEKYRKEALDYNNKQTELYNKRLEESNKARARAQRSRDSLYRARGQQYTPPPSNAQANNADSNENEEVRPPDKMNVPGFSVALSYKMKTEKRSGKFTINLNKYTNETRMNRFDENFGSLISRSKCSECFKRVLLDDPLYKQREIHARVDGSINSDDFGKYINSVEVLLRKKHENGETTLKGIQVDKKLFNEEGNDFVMLYGWKGDDNRDKWLEYEYKTKWSYFGGATSETEWTKTEDGVLGLAPEFVRKPVFIEGDEDFFNDENIRAVEVTLYSNVNGKAQSKKVRLKNKPDELSRTIDVVLPSGSNSFDYEIVYFIKGQEPKAMSRQSSTYGMIYLDTF